MNRRNFISKSSLAMIAAAGLPKAVLHNSQASTPSIYKTKLESGATNQTYYELSIDHSCLDNFSSATDEQKLIVLKVAYFETTDITTPTKGGEFNFIVSESKIINTTDNIWQVKAKLDKKVNGDYKLPKGFAKKMTLVGRKFSYFNIVDKDNAALVTIPYPPTTPTSSGSSGCFLTTACVQHKQLADDCNELTALRFLRDDFMMNVESNKILIDHYKIIGPQLVTAINNCINNAEIYDYMYSNMITPSVELVKKERFDEAIDHYKIFVKALAEKYL